MALGRHALKVGASFNTDTAHGIINPFATGPNSGFRLCYCDLNGDGSSTISTFRSRGIHSTAPVVPVPIPQVATRMARSLHRMTGVCAQNLTFNLGPPLGYDSD